MVITSETKTRARARARRLCLKESGREEREEETALRGIQFALATSLVLARAEPGVLNKGLPFNPL